ncbi:MAG: tetratricopeptide repeat protein [Gemmataceae bacterium]
MTEPITITHEYKNYTWDGQRWYGTTDFDVPTPGLTRRLNAMIADRLGPDDETITERAELLRRGKAARADGQLVRARDLVRRAHAKRPRDVGVAAELCELWRELGEPRKALLLADRYPESGHAPLQIARAGALCDLKRWDEALRQIREVLPAAGDPPPEAGDALAVLARIKTHAPRLFDAPAA